MGNRAATFERVTPLDDRLLRALSAYRRPLLTRFMKAITRTGTGHTYFLVAAALLGAGGLGWSLLPRQEQFVRSMLSSLLAWLAGSLLKRLFARERPRDAVIAVPTCRSFPSGHAAASMALAVTLALHHHPLWPAVMLWAAVVSLSRPYLGVHYPSDVAAGAVLGVACGLVGWRLM